MSIAKEGLDAEGMEVVVAHKLRPVIEGNRLVPNWGQGSEQGGLAGWPRGKQQTGVALMERQDGLAIEPEQHQVGLPVAGGGASRGRVWLSPGTDSGARHGRSGGPSGHR